MPCLAAVSLGGLVDLERKINTAIALLGSLGQAVTVSSLFLFSPVVY